MLVGRVPYLKMQVRSPTASGVAAPPQRISRLKNEVVCRRRCGVEAQGSASVCARHRPILDLRHKALQMGIHRGDSSRAFQIQGISVSPGRHFHPGHTPICRRHHHQSFSPLRFQVDPRVKVIATEFAKIAAQPRGNVKRLHPRLLGLERRRTGQILRGKAWCSHAHDERQHAERQNFPKTKTNFIAASQHPRGMAKG